MLTSTPPSSLRHMLQKSLTTFQHQSADPANAPAALLLPDTGAAPAPLAPSDEYATAQRRGARLLNVFATYPNSEALLLDAALRVDSMGKHATALLLYHLSLELYPSPKAYNNLAVLAAEDGNDDKALSWLEQGLERFPTDPILLENYAIFDTES